MKREERVEKGEMKRVCEEQEVEKEEKKGDEPLVPFYPPLFPF